MLQLTSNQKGFSNDTVLTITLHVTGCESSGISVGRHRVGLREQALDEELEGPGDDDGDGRGHLAHVFVDLHDLLDSRLKNTNIDVI